MCLSPLSIKNRKIGWSPYIDKHTIDVPCGHCYECNESYRSSWIIRAWYEHLDTVIHGGTTYYYTLTFNDANLPRYNTTPCFDKVLFQKFLKRFRKSLAKFGITIRYFVTSEYGENLHRPHHHILFFLNKKLPLSITKHGEESLLFRKLLCKAWPFGFVAITTEMGCEVKTFSALEYCAKYVTKDVNFAQSFDKATLDANPNIKPFHLQSRYFGLYMSQFCDKETLIKGYVEHIGKKGKTQKYPIPQYIIKKMLYNTYEYEDRQIQRLNTLGVEVKRAQMMHNVDELAIKFKTIFNNLDKYFLPEAFNGFKNAEEVRQQLIMMSDNALDFHQLACHFLIFKGRKVISDYLPLKTAVRTYIVEEGLPRTDDTVDDYFRNVPVQSFDSPSFDSCIGILKTMLNCKKYKEYTKRVDDFNSTQRVWALQSLKFKPIVKLTYKQFLNTLLYEHSTKSSVYVPF